jgi:hypothetical protein
MLMTSDFISAIVESGYANQHPGRPSVGHGDGTTWTSERLASLGEALSSLESHGGTLQPFNPKKKPGPSKEGCRAFRCSRDAQSLQAANGFTKTCRTGRAITQACNVSGVGRCYALKHGAPRQFTGQLRTWTAWPLGRIKRNITGEIRPEANPIEVILKSLVIGGPDSSALGFDVVVPHDSQPSRDTGGHTHNC